MRNTLLCVIIILVVFSCGKSTNPGSPVVARVGKSVLTESEFEKMQISVPGQVYSESDIISNWVDRELLFLAADGAGINDDETIKAQVDIYRKDLIGRTFLDDFISSNITVDNSEIRNYYDNNRSMFTHNHDGAKIMHFLVRVDTVAEFIAKNLRNSNTDIDRKDLLTNYMVDVLNVEKGSLIKNLDDAVFSNTRTNIVIGPIKTAYGYHVIEVLSRYRTGSKIDIDEAYDEIYQIIYNQKKQMRSSTFIDSLRNRYNVKIYLENN